MNIFTKHLHFGKKLLASAGLDATAPLPAPLSAAMDAIGRAQTIAEFHQACAPLGLHGARRFLHLELDIVNRCNLQCVMCYHSLEATRVPVVYLPPELFAVAAASILPHASHLSLSLGNEALMSPHFEAILALAAPFKVPHVNFFTNGLLLNDQKIMAMVAHGVTQVCISVDGATHDTYNSIRRGGDFDDLLRNVERLVALRAQADSATPRMRFDVVMMRRNIHELPDIVRLGARLGVQQLSFRHMVSFEGLGMDGESLVHAKAVSNYWLAQALETAAALGLEVQSHPALFDETASAPAVRAAPVAALDQPYCPFPFFHIAMGPGGHVLPCPHAHGQEPFGRLSEAMPLDKIWLNEKFAALRQRILRYDPPEMCQRCPFLADKYPNHDDLFATRKH